MSASLTLPRAAAAYAAQGWFVFPLRPRSKEPLAGSRGFKQACHQAEWVQRWWARWPEANIGLWPGPSGLIVIDADGAEGEETLARSGLLAEPTLTVVTGRGDGGRHLYFRGPPAPVDAATLGTGTTVRHYSGYVVAPPSVHPKTGARYTWAGRVTDLRPLPEAALAALTTEAERAPRPPGRPVGPVLGEGERNSTLASLAGSMRRRGMSWPAVHY